MSLILEKLAFNNASFYLCLQRKEVQIYMIDLEELANIRMRLLANGNNRLSIENQLNFLSANFEAESNRLQTEKESALARLHQDTEALNRSVYDSAKAKYDQQVSELKSQLTTATKTLDKQIAKKKSEYLESYTEVFEPLHLFNQYKSDIKESILAIPEHTLYKEATMPALQSPEDIMQYNQQLQQLMQLNDLTNINANKLENKFSLVLTPVEMIIDKVGEEKRMIVEIGYWFAVLSVVATYKMFLLPASLLGAYGFMGLRYRNSRILRNYCSTFFQVENHGAEIEELYKNILLDTYTQELEQYRQSKLSQFDEIYKQQVATFALPDPNTNSIDDASIEQDYTKKVQQLDLDKQDKQAQLTYQAEQNRNEFASLQEKIDSISQQCNTIIDEFEPNGVLPEYVHIGEITNTNYGVNYPSVIHSYKQSLGIVYDESSWTTVVDFVKYNLLQM